MQIQPEMDTDSDEGLKILADRLNETQVSESNDDKTTGKVAAVTETSQKVKTSETGQEKCKENEETNSECDKEDICDTESINEAEGHDTCEVTKTDCCENTKILETVQMTGGAGDAIINEATCTMEKSCDNFVDSMENLAAESEESDSEDEYESAEEGEESQADTQTLRELEESLTEEEKEERRKEAAMLKEEGNEYFRNGSYKTAIKTYSRALRTCPLTYKKDRAIMYSNRGACKMRMEDNENAIRDCSKAVELHPHYLKALMRRAELYEKTEKLDEALADFQAILELDPSQHSARAACARLPDMIKERNEKLKEEMMSKLKDLGNMVLRPFGLSTNNFNLNQDPNTGGYSVNFVQNPEQTS